MKINTQRETIFQAITIANGIRNARILNMKKTTKSQKNRCHNKRKPFLRKTFLKKSI